MDYQKILDDHLEFNANFICAEFNLKILNDFTCKEFTLNYFTSLQQREYEKIADVITSICWKDYVEKSGYSEGVVMFKEYPRDEFEPEFLDLVAFSLYEAELCDACGGEFQYEQDCKLCEKIMNEMKDKPPFTFSLFSDE